MSWRETLTDAGFKEFPVPQIGHKHATSAWQKRIRGAYDAATDEHDDTFIEVYHGEQLRRWHNLKTQIGDEGERANESGGTLNPALLTIGPV